MDLMTFVSDTEDAIDDNNLRRSDVDRLLGFFHGIPSFGSLWVITIFCFELRRGPGENYYQLFTDEMHGIARTLDTRMGRFEVSYGNPHVAAVFAASGSIIDRIRNEWDILHNV